MRDEGAMAQYKEPWKKMEYNLSVQNKREQELKEHEKNSSKFAMPLETVGLGID